MTKNMRLFVWERVLIDYSAGVMFALAETVEQAREQILAKCHYVPSGDLEKEPVAYDTPVGFAVWGGG